MLLIVFSINHYLRPPHKFMAWSCFLFYPEVLSSIHCRSERNATTSAVQFTKMCSSIKKLYFILVQEMQKILKHVVEAYFLMTRFYPLKPVSFSAVPQKYRGIRLPRNGTRDFSNFFLWASFPSLWADGVFCAVRCMYYVESLQNAWPGRIYKWTSLFEKLNFRGWNREVDKILSVP